MPDGRRLVLPLRDFGRTAVAGLIANQASFEVLDQLAAWTADAARPFHADIVVGLPTLGHVVGSAVARALGHSNWIAPSTTRKRWYDDELSVPLRSITAPASGANATRRMWLDPRLLPRLAGRRVLLVDDVISTGSSAMAGLKLARLAGFEPVALAVAMIQGELWTEVWPQEIPVAAAFRTRVFTVLRAVGSLADQSLTSFGEFSPVAGIVCIERMRGVFMVSDVATLGAAIVIARNAKTLEEIERALTDAGWLMNPSPTDIDYKAWQTMNGRTPTTRDEDRALEAVQRMATELKRMR